MAMVIEQVARAFRRLGFRACRKGGKLLKAADSRLRRKFNVGEMEKMLMVGLCSSKLYKVTKCEGSFKDS